MRSVGSLSNSLLSSKNSVWYALYPSIFLYAMILLTVVLNVWHKSKSVGHLLIFSYWARDMSMPATWRNAQTAVLVDKKTVVEELPHVIREAMLPISMSDISKHRNMLVVLLTVLIGYTVSVPVQNDRPIIGKRTVEFFFTRHWLIEMTLIDSYSVTSSIFFFSSSSTNAQRFLLFSRVIRQVCWSRGWVDFCARICNALLMVNFEGGRVAPLVYDWTDEHFDYVLHHSNGVATPTASTHIVASCLD